MRYRSKPSEVEAYQLTAERIAAHLLDEAPLPGVRVTSSNIHRGRREVWGTSQSVTTIQGQDVPVSPGEWIVQEPDGVHYYPISDAIFRAKYEPAT